MCLVRSLFLIFSTYDRCMLENSSFGGLLFVSHPILSLITIVSFEAVTLLIGTCKKLIPRVDPSYTISDHPRIRA
jgi:hypothetical protein